MLYEYVDQSVLNSGKEMTENFFPHPPTKKLHYEVIIKNQAKKYTDNKQKLYKAARHKNRIPQDRRKCARTREEEGYNKEFSFPFFKP